MNHQNENAIWLIWIKRERYRDEIESETTTTTIKTIIFNIYIYISILDFISFWLFEWNKQCFLGEKEWRIYGERYIRI